MKFKKYVGSWNAENKKEITGKILNIEEEGGKYDTKVYTLETEDEIIDIFGSAVLDKILKPICKIGNTIRILFLGMKQGKDAEYKTYEVSLGTEDDN